MRNEQWIFDENFPVPGQIENLWKLNYFEDIYIKFWESEQIEI